jgi:predicted ATPase
MIERLYVDNFRTLQDFTWQPAAESLVLGYNGSGKTTVMDALEVVRSWAWSWDRLENLLPPENTTRWSTSESVRLELDVKTKKGAFRYKVEFQVPRATNSEPLVRAESLIVDDRSVLARMTNEVRVFNGGSSELAKYPLPRNQSAVTSVFASDWPDLAGAFLTALAQMVVVRPIPLLFQTEVAKPESRAHYRFENFIAWYQYQIQGGKFDVKRLLSQAVWDDFDYLRLTPVGGKFGMEAVFKTPQSSGEFVLRFQELSDGEQMLIVLYSLLAYQKATPGTTIFIDEPDNFVALSELQPWLLAMLDERPENGQVILVSHNPEIIQTMGESKVSLFSRESHTSPTRVMRLEPDESGLSLSERLARGWVNA